jgi:hypothetical protein
VPPETDRAVDSTAPRLLIVALARADPDPARVVHSWRAPIREEERAPGVSQVAGQLLVVRIVGVWQNADRPPEARASGFASAAADRLVIHMHSRTDLPAIQNHAVEQPPTSVV